MTAIINNIASTTTPAIHAIIASLANVPLTLESGLAFGLGSLTCVESTRFLMENSPFYISMTSNGGIQLTNSKGQWITRTSPIIEAKSFGVGYCYFVTESGHKYQFTDASFMLKMKKYRMATIIDDHETELFICELTEDNVVEAEKEFSCYMQSKGKTYDLDTNKHPTVRNFFKLYFGGYEYGLHCLDSWITPDRYICENKEVADRFMKLARQLDYHDRYNQTFCTVEQKREIVDVFYGDY